MERRTLEDRNINIIENSLIIDSCSYSIDIAKCYFRMMLQSPRIIREGVASDSFTMCPFKYHCLGQKGKTK